MFQRTFASSRWFSASLTIILSATLWFAPETARAQNRVLMVVEPAGLPFEQEGAGGVGDALRDAGFTFHVIDALDANATDPDSGTVIGSLAGTVPFSQAQLDFLLSYDLLYLTRSLNSGNYNNTPEEITQWNMLEVPALMGSVHLTRQNRWQWFNSDALIDFEAAGANSTGFTVTDPDHPVFAGGLTGEMFSEVLNVQANNNQAAANNGVFLGIHDNNPEGVVMAIWEEAGLFHPAATPGVGEHVAPRAYHYQMRYHETDAGAGVPANYSQNGLDLIVSLANYLVGSEFVPAPFITDVSPANGSVFNDPTAGLNFTISSPADIPVEGIVVTVNGVDVSGDLQIAGSTTERQVAYDGLEANTIYEVEISVTNETGNRIVTLAFDTFLESESLVIESEDYNFSADGKSRQPVPARPGDDHDLGEGIGGLEQLHGDDFPVVLDPEAGSEQVSSDLRRAHAGEPGAIELDGPGLPVHRADRHAQPVCALLIRSPEPGRHAERGRDRQPDLVLVLVLAGGFVDHDPAGPGVGR
jgi:hypothetical protein